MDPECWEEVDSSSGVMISNLPLLFAKGQPTALQCMSLAELEGFLPFLVQCSVGEEGPAVWSKLPRPSWWPSKLPFRIPTSSNPRSTRTLLVKLVERCYSFHGCEYLLHFCKSLVAQQPTTGYRFYDNRDGTTSMFDKATGKLLVTFRNENRDYDKHLQGSRSPSHKKLLPQYNSAGASGGAGGSAMVHPPIGDIYLCDKCDNEFQSLKEVQVHEKQCNGDLPGSPDSPTMETDQVEEEQDPQDQVPFLSYFKLQPASHTGLQPYQSPRKRSSSSPPPAPRRRFGPNYFRYDSIDLSSPLGRYLLAHSKFGNKFQPSQQQVMRYERHIHATPNMSQENHRDRTLDRYANRWMVVWKGLKNSEWTHLYCFNKSQRRDRLLTLKTGLNFHSRLLKSRCKRVTVKLRRLTKAEINRYVKRISELDSCIDLTSEERSVLPIVQSFSSPLVDTGIFAANLSATGIRFTPRHSAPRLPFRQVQRPSPTTQPQSAVRAATPVSVPTPVPTTAAAAPFVTNTLMIPRLPGTVFAAPANHNSLVRMGYFTLAGQTAAPSLPRGYQQGPVVVQRGQPFLGFTGAQGAGQLSTSSSVRHLTPASTSNSAHQTLSGAGTSFYENSQQRLLQPMPLDVRQSVNNPSSRKSIDGHSVKMMNHSSIRQTVVTSGGSSSNSAACSTSIAGGSILQSQGQITLTSPYLIPIPSLDMGISHPQPAIIQKSQNSESFSKTPVNKPLPHVEVIELSSDDDEDVQTFPRAAAAHSTYYQSNTHHHANVPKNGNSHWSSADKSYGFCKAKDLATNGSARRSPQAATPAQHLAEYPPARSSSLDPDEESISVHVDDEVSFRLPLVIKEEVCGSPEVQNVNDDRLECDINSKDDARSLLFGRTPIISQILSTVSKGVDMIRSLVKPLTNNTRDSLSNKNGEPCNSEVLNHDKSHSLQIPVTSHSAPNYVSQLASSFSSPVSISSTSLSSITTTSWASDLQKKRRARRNYMLRALLGDECKELRRRGLHKPMMQEERHTRLSLAAKNCLARQSRMNHVERKTKDSSKKGEVVIWKKGVQKISEEDTKGQSLQHYIMKTASANDKSDNAVWRSITRVASVQVNGSKDSVERKEGTLKPLNRVACAPVSSRKDCVGDGELASLDSNCKMCVGINSDLHLNNREYPASEPGIACWNRTNSNNSSTSNNNDLEYLCSDKEYVPMNKKSKCFSEEKDVMNLRAKKLYYDSEEIYSEEETLGDKDMDNNNYIPVSRFYTNVQKRQSRMEIYEEKIEGQNGVGSVHIENQDVMECSKVCQKGYLMDLDMYKDSDSFKRDNIMSITSYSVQKCWRGQKRKGSTELEVLCHDQCKRLRGSDVDPPGKGRSCANECSVVQALPVNSQDESIKYSSSVHTEEEKVEVNSATKSFLKKDYFESSVDTGVKEKIIVKKDEVKTCEADDVPGKKSKEGDSCEVKKAIVSDVVGKEGENKTNSPNKGKVKVEKNHKRRSKEWQQLLMDECKELRRGGFSPSDITRSVLKACPVTRRLAQTLYAGPQSKNRREKLFQLKCDVKGKPCSKTVVSSKVRHSKDQKPSRVFKDKKQCSKEKVNSVSQDKEKEHKKENNDKQKVKREKMAVEVVRGTLSDSKEVAPVSVGNSVQGRKRKRKNELENLANDECKEFKRGGFHPSDITYSYTHTTSAAIEPTMSPSHDIHGKGMQYRSLRSEGRRDIESLDSSAVNQFSPMHSSNRREEGVDEELSEWAMMRNTRSQSNIVCCIKKVSARSSHRNLLLTEIAMCVLDYSIPKVGYTVP